MPASFPFKRGIPRDTCCLIFDHSAQNLTGDIVVFDAFRAHGKVGMALAFLLVKAAPWRCGEQQLFTIHRKGTHNGKVLL